MWKEREREEFRMALGFLTKDIEKGASVGRTVELGSQ